MSADEAIAAAISQETGKNFQPASSTSCAGGCINDSKIVKGEDGREYFVKINGREYSRMFAAELQALHAIRETNTIRVPGTVCCGEAGLSSYLVLEKLEFGPPDDWYQMGRQLARLHRNTAEDFGWKDDNFIGATPQINSRHETWVEFFRLNRLSPQFEMAKSNGLTIESAAELLDRLPEFLDGYEPVPSLLHGDLWSGNAGFLNDGTPVVFDPASHYGDRETDIAFTHMFGGFQTGFYSGYEAEWPLQDGYKRRESLYNLYHELNHYNLFGGGYGRQAMQTVNSLLKTI